MKGVTHVLSGAAAWQAAGQLSGLAAHMPVTHAAVYTAVAAGAAAIPDDDQCGSTVARTFGPLTEGVAAIVHRLSGGHREGTHSLIGIAVLPVITFAGMAAARAPWHGATGAAVRVGGAAAAGLILVLAVASWLQALHLAHRRLADVLALAAAIALLTGHPGVASAGLAAAVAVGAAAHIAGDMLTVHGCPLLWPASEECAHLLPRKLRIVTGTLPELVIRITLIGYLIWAAA